MILDQQYKSVKAGTLTPEQFIKEAREDSRLSKYITNFDTFEDVVNMLKNKGLLFEETEITKKFSVSDWMSESLTDEINVPKGTVNSDHVNAFEFEKGWRYELNASGGKLIDEDMNKAKAKAVKNVEKDALYYTKIEMGDNVPDETGHKPLDVSKGDNFTDEENAAKPVKVKEKDEDGVAKEYLKLSKEKSTPKKPSKKGDLNEGLNEYADGEEDDYNDIEDTYGTPEILSILDKVDNLGFDLPGEAINAILLDKDFLKSFDFIDTPEADIDKLVAWRDSHAKSKTLKEEESTGTGSVSKDGIAFRGSGGNVDKLYSDMFGDNVLYLTDNLEYASSFALDKIEGSMNHKMGINGKVEQFDISTLKIYKVTEGQYFKEAVEFNNKERGRLTTEDLNKYNESIKQKGFDTIKVERTESFPLKGGASDFRTGDHVSEYLILDKNKKLPQHKVEESTGTGSDLRSLEIKKMSNLIKRLPNNYTIEKSKDKWGNKYYYVLTYKDEPVLVGDNAEQIEEKINNKNYDVEDFGIIKLNKVDGGEIGGNGYTLTQQANLKKLLNIEEGDPRFSKFTLKVKQPGYRGTIKRDAKGWQLYDDTNHAEEGPFSNLGSLMSHFYIDKSEVSGEYAKNLKYSFPIKEGPLADLITQHDNDKSPFDEANNKTLVGKSVSFTTQGKDYKKSNVTGVVGKMKYGAGGVEIVLKDGSKLVIPKTHKPGAVGVYIPEEGAPQKVVDLSKEITGGLSLTEDSSNKLPTKTDWSVYVIQNDKKLIAGFNNREEAIEYIHDNPQKGLVSHTKDEVSKMEAKFNANKADNWKNISTNNFMWFKEDVDENSPRIAELKEAIRKVVRTKLLKEFSDFTTKAGKDVDRADLKRLLQGVEFPPVGEPDSNLQNNGYRDNINQQKIDKIKTTIDRMGQEGIDLYNSVATDGCKWGEEDELFSMKEDDEEAKPVKRQEIKNMEDLDPKDLAKQVLTVGYPEGSILNKAAALLLGNAIKNGKTDADVKKAFMMLADKLKQK